jgi:phosphoribosyl 1,2-cyclic phosphodiesterase
MKYRVCSLFSGSSGNATYIGNDNTHILIDAGQSCKQITEALSHVGIKPGDLDCILISHEHSDHIKSAGLLSRRFDIPIYANENTWLAMEKHMEEVSSSNVRFFDDSKTFSVKDIAIKPYSIPHDAASPVGFCFFCGKRKVSIATDLGHTNNDIINTIMDSDMVILESNHDMGLLQSGPYPPFLKKRIMGKKGHLSNIDAGNALVEMVKCRVTHALLAHLSKENNLPQLAYNTVKDILLKGGIKVDYDVMLDIAHRNTVGNIYYL